MSMGRGHGPVDSSSLFRRAVAVAREAEQLITSLVNVQSSLLVNSKQLQSVGRSVCSGPGVMTIDPVVCDIACWLDSRGSRPWEMG
jgi:hypothetical protein